MPVAGLVVVALSILLAAEPALAGATTAPGTDPAAAVLARLAQTYEDMASVEADFTQTSTGMSYPEPLVQEGRLVLERPGRMLWQFVRPTPQRYLSDGATLWVVDDADRTCTVFRSLDATLSLYFGFLFGMEDVREHFDVTSGGPVEGMDVLVLRPLVKDGTIGQLEVRIARQTGLVTEVHNTTPFGDRTEMRLANLKTGRDIPDSEFAWTSQPGYREVEGE